MSKESKNQFGDVEVIDLDKKSEDSFITTAEPEEIEIPDNSDEKPLEEDDEKIIPEGEPVEEETDVPSDDDDDIDPYLYLGKILQEDGGLDSEFELKKGVSLKDLGQGVYSKLKKEYEPQILSELQKELESQGYSERELQLAKLMRGGVDVNLLQNSLLVFERLSEYNEDADESVKTATVRADFMQRGYNNEDIDVIIEKIKEKEELDSKYKESTVRFQQKTKSLYDEQNKLIEDRNKKTKEAVEANVNLIKNKLSSGEILGEKISKETAREIDNSIFKTEIFDINGQKVNMSKFDKFVYDFNNDVELRVSAFKKYAFKDSDLSDIKKEVKKETEKEFIDAYKKSVQKSQKKVTKNNPLKSQLDKEFTTGRLVEI